MNRLLAGGSLLIAALCLVDGAPAAAQTLARCSSPDALEIMVAEGFDCEVFFEPFDLPTGLVVEDSGNVLVTSSGATVNPRSVFRFSPEGALLDFSDPIVDPDGVAVGPNGQVFVAGAPLTIANSLDGGFDQVCRNLPGNPQDVAVDSQGRIVAMDSAGTVAEVVCNTSDVVCETFGPIGLGVAFDKSDRLFATVFGPGEGLFRIDQCQPGTGVRIATLNGARRVAFGPGERFGEEIFVTDEDVRNAGRIVTIDEASGAVTVFATGFAIPNGIGFDGQETLYVTDLLRNRIIAIGAVNDLPIADAGPNQMVACTSLAGTPVTLDGSGSFDPDGDALTYRWTGPFPEGGGEATGVAPTVTLFLGKALITLVVNDGQADSNPDPVKISVENSTPPGVVASLTAVGEGDEAGDDDEGRFRIDFAATAVCDPAPTIAAVLVVGAAPDITEIEVTNGQVIEFEVEDEETSVESEDDVLEIEALSLTLRVTVTDAAGNATVVEVQPSGLNGDNDDDTIASAEDDD